MGSSLINGVTTEPVSFEFVTQTGSVANHVGLIALNTDETTEYDFHCMLPDDADAMFYTSRLTTVNPITSQNLIKMGPQLKQAASLILPDVPLKAIAYSCTSATAVLGFEEVQRQIRSGLPSKWAEKTCIVTPLSAAHEALHAMQLKNVCLLTPYVDEVNQQMKKAFEDSDIGVQRIKSLLVPSDVDIARVDTDDIVRAAVETDHKDADALFISCTALRSVHVLDQIEQKIGKPVLSSNQCMFWAFMRACGYDKPIEGYGSLLARFL